MERIIFIFAILANCSMLFAQSAMSQLYKQWMIEDINNRRFEKAADEISHIETWPFDASSENDYIDISAAIDFIDFADSIHLDSHLQDSLLLYFAQQLDVYGYYEYIDSNYVQAISYYELAGEIKKSVLGRGCKEVAEQVGFIGALYYNIHDYKNAEKNYAEALSSYELIQGDRGDNYIILLKNISTLYRNDKRYYKAIESNNLLLDIYASRNESASIDYANTLVSLGFLYKQVNDFQSAEAYYAQALSAKKYLLGESHQDVANLLVDMGILQQDEKDYINANKYFSQALSILKETVGQSNPLYYRTLLNYGSLYAEIGEYQKALDAYQQVSNAYREMCGSQHWTYASSLTGIGDVYVAIGDYYNAEQFLLKALNIYIEQGYTHNEDYWYVGVLNSLGVLYYFNLKDYEKGEQYFQETLDVLNKMSNADDVLRAKILNNLGLIYNDVGEYENAEKYLIESLHIKDSIWGDKNSDYAETIMNLGNMYSAKGDFLKAEQYYIKGTEIIKNVLGEQSLHYATCLHQLGCYYHDTNSKDKALKYFIQALKIREGELSPQNSDYLSTLFNIGNLYYYMSDYENAEKFFKKEYDISKQKFTQSLSSFTERQRGWLLSSLQGVFYIIPPVLAYRNWENGNLTTINVYDNELLSKGILLYSADAVKRSIMDSNDSILIGNWNNLLQVRQKIDVINEGEPQPEYFSQLEKEAELLEKELTIHSASFRQSQEIWNITWDSVRNHLGNNQVAIEYMTAPLNEDSTMYCALLLRNNCKYPEFVPLFEEKEVLSLINTTSENQTSFTYSYGGNGQTLQQLVWSKVLPYIKPGETIYFAPSGILHQLAIEALPYDEMQTMADMFNLVRLSSTREIVLRKDETQHSTATLYGGIQYNMTGDELLAESEQYAASNLLASRGIEDEALDRGSVKYLPGTKKEVESINQMLHDNNLSVKLYISTTANEESFKAISGKHQNILHIATHGFYWADSTAKKKDYFSQRMLMMDDKTPTPPTIDPLNRCGLLFAGANTALSGHSADLPEGVQDGILTAKEISLLDLRDADLVVLSACETGKGEITGEGVFGLQRAFKQAGAQTIIMSLWPVNDAATQLLMTEFYRNWITNHQSKREAFRNAQNTVRSIYEELVYWAGFIMLD